MYYKFLKFSNVRFENDKASTPEYMVSTWKILTDGLTRCFTIPK